jgi:dolichol kinase
MDLFLITGLLFVWNLIVIHYVSKWFFEYCKRFKGVPTEYVGRKIVHIFGGGFTSLLVPVFFEGHYWIVTISAFVLACYIFFRRRWRMMDWFQVRENAFEVHFAIVFGAILMVGDWLGNVWIGLIPMLFMSFGDSVTGLIRAFTQRKQVKSWDGTAAMFIVCSIIGVWKLGSYGLAVSAIVSLVEKIPKIDDNITVPIVTAALVYLICQSFRSC